MAASTSRRVERHDNPRVIEWLDHKMAEHGDGKLIPPMEVIEAELEKKLEERARAAITERILREADLEGQVRVALDAIGRPSRDELREGIERMFDDSPEREWRAYVEQVVTDRSEKI